jgi:hypothetical protein
MRFVEFSDVATRLRGKRIAVVGSAPSCLDNAPGFVDGHDIVIRVNNYRVGPQQGYRADVHYSFYGSSIRKTVKELKRDGVTMCLCKCPNAKPIESEWHERHGKLRGIDFSYIYETRAGWWFADTYVPDVPSFMQKFELLERHIPTTGFAAILDVLACEPKSLYLTGFDFFASGVHNVNERWRPGDPADPIGHRPGMELDWLCENAHKHRIECDTALKEMIIHKMTRAA